MSPVQRVTNFGFLLLDKHTHTGYFKAQGVTMLVCNSLVYDLPQRDKAEEHFSLNVYLSHRKN